MELNSQQHSIGMTGCCSKKIREQEDVEQIAAMKKSYGSLLLSSGY